MLSLLSKQIFEEVNKAFSHQGSAEDGPKLQAGIEAILRKLNLVTREEFDAQAAVLLRTRERLEALEAKVTQAEELDQSAAIKGKTSG